MAAHFGPESRAILKTSMGDLTLEFLPGKAPRTCEHFVKLAKQGFYDGLSFHRVLKDFMVQTGCPRGDGTGGPGFTMRAEFNDTPHVKGTVSLARGSDPHSGGSQFFICHGEARYLDSRYAAFARVVEGLEVLDRIASVAVEENRYKERSVPREPVFLNSVLIEGVEVEAEEPIIPRGGRGEARGEARGESRGEGRGEGRGDDDDGPDGDGDSGDDDRDDNDFEDGDGAPPSASAEASDGDNDNDGERAAGAEGEAAPGGAAEGEAGEKRRRSRRGRSRGKGGRRPPQA